MSNLLILPMQPMHLNQVHDLCVQAFSDPWSRQGILSELGQDGALSLVALLQNHVVGYLNARHLLHEGDLNLIVVRQGFRRAHIGTVLLEEMLSYGQANRISSYMLEVRASSAAAIAFYHRHGFVQVGRRRQYYRNPAEDALLMRKDLQATEELPSL